MLSFLLAFFGLIPLSVAAQPACVEALTSMGNARVVREWILTNRLNYTEQTRIVKTFGEFEVELILNSETHDALLDGGDVNFLNRASEAGDAYVKKIREVTQFVTHKYGEQRGWKPEFLQLLLKKAIANDMNSSYIIVRRTGVIVGSMRLTFAPYQVFLKYGKSIAVTGMGDFPDDEDLQAWFQDRQPFPLPAELVMKTRSPRPPMLKVGPQWKLRTETRARDLYRFPASRVKAIMEALQGFDLAIGVLVEPSSFRIDDTLSPGDATTVFAHLIEGMSACLNEFKLQWPSYTPTERALPKEQYFPLNAAGTHSNFLTYGDMLSARYYRPLGYDLQRAVELTPEQGAPSDSTWYFLTSTAQQYVQALQNISHRLAAGGASYRDIMESIDRSFTRVDLLNVIQQSSDETPQWAPLEDRWYRSYPQ